jgi:hypothetical protein
MATRTLRLVPWSTVTEEILPAFEKARDDGELAPLRPYVPGEALDPLQHILTGKRFIVFGPEEDKLIGAGKLLEQALAKIASHSFRAGPEMHAWLAAAQHGEAGDAAARWQAALVPETNLPKWMWGERGPSLIPPSTCAELRTDAQTLAATAAIQSDADLRQFSGRLVDFLGRAADDDGLSASGADPTG